jgi:hypothetical protein
MKRFALAALAVFTLFSLAGCDLFGSTSNATPAAGSNLSQWWIKGSFDNWTGVADQDAITAANSDKVHYLTIDSLNPKLLTYEISVPAGLKTFTYQFVVMNDGAAGSRINFQASSATAMANNANYTLVASTTAGATNANFVATATTYTVQVDITTPAAPVVKLIPGATASVHYTAAELASGMKVAGGKLSMGWTETAGVFDGVNTVTWTNVGTTDKSSPVYFHADAGYFKAPADVVSPTTLNGTVTAALSGSNDFNLTGVPYSDSKYKFDVIIDPTATSFGQAFTFKATLTTVGTANWAFTPWTTAYFVGSDSTVVGDWGLPNAGPFTVTATTASNIATLHITPASTETLQFKIVPEAAWGKDIGFAGIDVAAGSLPLSSSGGNIAVDLTGGTSYTITVDFSTANYIANGVPTVKVVTP